MPDNPTTGLTKRPMSAVGGTGFLAGALALLATAHGVASRSSDPSGRAAILLTSCVVIASVAMMGCAAWILVTAMQSHWHHVFCGRRLLTCGLMLLAVSGVLVAFLVIGRPFHELASHGRFGAGVLVDLGSLVGAFLCLTGAGLALVSAWDAFDEERHWGRTMGVGR